MHRRAFPASSHRADFANERLCFLYYRRNMGFCKGVFCAILMLYPTDFREDGDTMNDFSKNVYLAVQKIPRGKVTNYGCIAFLAGKPRAARGVGFVHPLPPRRVQGRLPVRRLRFRRAGRAARASRRGRRRLSAGRPRRYGGLRLVRRRQSAAALTPRPSAACRTRQAPNKRISGSSESKKRRRLESFPNSGGFYAYFLKLMLISTGVLMPCTCALSEYCQTLKS